MCQRKTLRRAGYPITGRANMHELALGVTSDNAFTGRVDNPALPGHLVGAGFPSICLPLGGSPPVGILLDGLPGHDRQLLAVAADVASTVDFG